MENKENISKNLSDSSSMLTSKVINEKHSSNTALASHYDRLRTIQRISTGSQRFDNLLAGGIETKAVTQFYGQSGSGKTQICHILCSIVPQNKSSGGLDAKSIYIDTEESFRP